MIYLIFLTLSIISTTLAGYAGSYSGNIVGPGGITGGYGYGYGGSGNVPPEFPQFFSQFPFDFSNFLRGTNAFAYTSVSVDPPFQGKVSARASITFHGIDQIRTAVEHNVNAAAAADNSVNYASGYPYAGGYSSHGYGGSFGGGFGGAYSGGYGGQQGYNNVGVPGGYAAPNVRTTYASHGPSGAGVPEHPGYYSAGASASIGNTGVHQTAFLNPPNPVMPNVNLRYAPSGHGGVGKSVYVSSSSSSGNINGRPYGHRQASTTVNDNGQVTSYSVHD